MFTCMNVSVSELVILCDCVLALGPWGPGALLFWGPLGNAGWRFCQTESQSVEISLRVNL